MKNLTPFLHREGGKFKVSLLEGVRFSRYREKSDQRSNTVQLSLKLNFCVGWGATAPKRVSRLVPLLLSKLRAASPLGEASGV